MCVQSTLWMCVWSTFHIVDVRLEHVVGRASRARFGCAFRVVIWRMLLGCPLRGVAQYDVGLLRCFLIRGVASWGSSMRGMACVTTSTLSADRLIVVTRIAVTGDNTPQMRVWMRSCILIIKAKLPQINAGFRMVG